MSKLIKTSLIYIGTDAINKGIPFLILPIITRYLTPAEFGIVSNFIILFTILTAFVGINIDGAISSNYFQMPKHKLRIFIGNALLVSSISFIIWIIIVLIFNKQIYNFSKIPLKYILFATMTSFFQIISMVNLALWRLEEKP
ncbi:lipopolysaccharide biosynthesis protein, partial [Sphingobacterium daejeonense]|uniref:lipopolysaccharide biosynthesis protein n=1 Tax=Sphingobacterium daejeonense TaxID=371142 RepID=UPI003D311744